MKYGLLALVVGCGPSGVSPSDGGGTTGGSGSSTGMSPSTSSSTAVPDDDTGTSLAESSGTTDTSGSSTGLPDPVPDCQTVDCVRSCTVEEDFGSTGDACECTNGVYAEDRVDCRLPAVCEGKGHHCIVQALRYGVAGAFSFIGGDGRDYWEARVEILGDGRARALTFTQEHTCCGGVSVDSEQREGFPVPVRAVADPFWTQCLAEVPDRDDWFAIPSCYAQESFGTGACDGPLETCPELDAHVPGCEAECPMANDGVCDESVGTGLCADGCDPIDCTCEADTKGSCDEISVGGSCPFGSDPDECPGE